MRHINPVRFDNARSLSEDDLRRMAPSVFAVSAHYSRSERFKPIPTIEVLRGLAREGFVPVSAQQSTTRMADRQDFTKHMIRLRQVDKTYSVGDTVAEIALKNANDGTSAYELLPALFRIACLNGMVSKLSDIDSLKVRHSGDVQSKVIDGTFTVIEDAKLALAAPEQWTQIRLDREEQRIMAESVRALRFADAEGNVDTPISAEQFLQVRRQEDTENNLWVNFNVMQENAIRGGLHGVRVDANLRRRRFSTRPVTSIDGDVRLNRALWTLASKMAEYKGWKAPEVA